MIQEELDTKINDEAEINVTPLVNISLVLVLVFMVANPFIVKNLIPVQLPKAVSSETEHEENISITISPEEGFVVNEEPVDKKNLKMAMRTILKNTGISFVLIRADERVPHGEVEDVLKMAKQVGVKRIAFGTQPKNR